MFGSVENGQMRLSRLGEIAEQYWKEILRHYPGVSLDEFQIMPDHMHGIVVIGFSVEVPVADASQSVRAAYMLPQHARQQQHRYQHVLPKSVSTIIQTYKAAVTHWSRKQGMFYDVWQRNYYERVIRNYEEWEMIQAYIHQNPENWEL